jgi:DNA primase
MYKCFGCGEGGSVITFLQKYENYTFPEAIKYLAERAGVELPEETNSAANKARDNRRARLLEVNKEAAKYYYYLFVVKNIEKTNMKVYSLIYHFLQPVYLKYIFEKTNYLFQ